MKWFLVPATLVALLTPALVGPAGCGGAVPLRSRAAEETLGRHERMLLLLLAYVRGEYGVDSRSGYDALRRDLVRLAATAADLAGLLSDDPRVAGAWKAYVERGLAQVEDLEKAKKLTRTLVATYRSWRPHDAPGDNDMTQLMYISLIGAAAAKGAQQSLEQQREMQGAGAGANAGAGGGGGSGGGSCARCQSHVGAVKSACGGDSQSPRCYNANADMNDCMANAPGCVPDPAATRAEAARLRQMAREIAR